MTRKLRVIIDGRAEILILARGGGAVEDLSCFDSEIVVRAIAECSIPVITGIGHERDESLADLVADVRAATPTTAAAISVPDIEDLIDDRRIRVDCRKRKAQAPPTRISKRRQVFS